MGANDILFPRLTRSQMGDGLDTLAAAVSVTFRPGGRNVLLERLGVDPIAQGPPGR
jgi:hypothetical protein